MNKEAERLFSWSRMGTENLIGQKSDDGYVEIDRKVFLGLRKNRGLSTKTVAERIGIAHTSLYRIETGQGRARLRAEVAEKLLEVLK